MQRRVVKSKTADLLLSVGASYGIRPTNVRQRNNGQTTIYLSDDVVARLMAERKAGESLDDVIIRLCSTAGGSRNG